MSRNLLRPEATAQYFHDKQRDTLPGRYGLELTTIAEGVIDARMSIQPWMHAPNGFLHAASLVMLADTCAGYGSIAHLPEGAKGFTTIELKSNFFATALEGELRCECRADHLGRRTHVWSATVFDAKGRKLALFRCTQMILD